MRPKIKRKWGEREIEVEAEEEEEAMGGKGRKRREKNFQAAHGGYTRLPPPPNPSELDPLPSKLRRIMEFTTPSTTPGSSKVLTGTERGRKKRDGGGAEKKLDQKDEFDCKTVEFKEGGKDENVTTPKHKDDSDEIVHKNTHDKRKAKRKRRQVNDLRFEMSEDLGVVGLKRRERKKKYLEARKKKHKKDKTGDKLEFPGHEQIQFGDVVKAPPKLVSFPKVSKTVRDASHERLRLQAVEAYRNRKGWVSRPGIRLPPSITATPSS